MKIILVKPTLSLSAIEKNKNMRKKILSKKTFHELKYTFNSALEKLDCVRFGKFFKPSKSTREKYIDKIIFLEALPYDHFERFGYIYMRNLYS